MGSRETQVDAGLQTNEGTTCKPLLISRIWPYGPLFPHACTRRHVALEHAPVSISNINSHVGYEPYMAGSGTAAVLLMALAIFGMGAKPLLADDYTGTLSQEKHEVTGFGGTLDPS